MAAVRADDIEVLAHIATPQAQTLQEIDAAAVTLLSSDGGEAMVGVIAGRVGRSSGAGPPVRRSR